MKTIIIYATKTGTTKKCANLLESYLSNSEVVDIDDINSIDVNNYEQIIIGSYIRMGMIEKRVKKFISKNLEILKKKSTAVFLCCAFNENINKYFKDNISSELLAKLVVYDTFGGELDLSKQKGFDKFIVKMVAKSNPDKKVELSNDRIEKFSQKLKSKD